MPQTIANPPLMSDVPQEALEQNVRRVLDTLSQSRYGSQEPAKLIAVTKTVDAQVINRLKPLGVMDIGENRAQVALPKLVKISPDFRLHWIGRLQTNKVKGIIDHVCMLHTLDRMELAQEVDRRAGQRGRVLPALVQVNIAGEVQKGGLAPEELMGFLREMKSFHQISIEGLMAIMPLGAPEEELTRLFKGMRTLFEQVRAEAMEHVHMNELSMGMSNDYAIAAREGATMVRIGTALYRRG